MIYLDDAIMQKGKTASAGSKMLENFTAPIDAAVAVRLTVPAESIKLGAFGLQPPGKLPTGKLPEDAPVLCSDVFGHVRIQAAKQGLCYIRPTYGTVSRYGLIPSVCSMDQIGVVCKNPREGFALLEQVAGHDENDGAMFPEKSYSYKNTGKPVISREKTPYSDVYDAVLQILAYAEISGNLSRYDGIKYGFRAENCGTLSELYTKTRTEAFSTEEKFAVIMGCLVLSQGNYERYYEKAMKLRRLIKQSLSFDKYDVLAVPVGSPLAVLAGLPSITFGDTELVADVKNENALFAAWEGAQ
ncbi:MAG: amidase family protein [Oscillospiraceae bacterium]|nr:amidase family protein [Oscillospiraceae bacterium]